MLEIEGLTKRFGKKAALDHMTCHIENGSIFGLVGSNGSGKSTLLRTIARIYQPDGGTVKWNGMPTFEHVACKGSMFFVPDFPYFFYQATIYRMADFYKKLYPGWDPARFEELCGLFPLEKDLRISSMSKGMQRQAALILALSTRPELLLLDEVFDGLDPVVRQLLKRLLAQEVGERGMTIVIASHNLRELEDLCDHVGLLHKGGVVFERELDELKLGIHKIQAAYMPELPADALEGLDVVKQDKRGSLYSFVIRGQREEILEKLNALGPVFIEALPLTLEEVFISEMEGVGYDIDHIIH